MMRAMTATLDNGILRAEFAETGAELVSARLGGAEFVWGGDPAFWSGRCPVMFPICGRLPGGKYSWEGREYALGTHGFARKSRFAVASATDVSVRFELRDSEETRAAYPFEFLFAVEYALEGSAIRASATVRNDGPGVLPFAVGFHPGFNVPVGGGGFSDWEVAFGAPCAPERILFTEAGLQTGRRVAFPLRGGVSIPLSHGMFDDDAVFLAGASRSAVLRSPLSPFSVGIEFPDFPYFGVWHPPRTEAPFVCLEPWSGLPSADVEAEDFATKGDMARLPPGDSRTWRATIRFSGPGDAPPPAGPTVPPTK